MKLLLISVATGVVSAGRYCTYTTSDCKSLPVNCSLVDENECIGGNNTDYIKGTTNTSFITYNDSNCTSSKGDAVTIDASNTSCIRVNMDQYIKRVTTIEPTKYVCSYKNNDSTCSTEPIYCTSSYTDFVPLSDGLKYVKYDSLIGKYLEYTSSKTPTLITYTATNGCDQMGTNGEYVKESNTPSTVLDQFCVYKNQDCDVSDTNYKCSYTGHEQCLLYETNVYVKKNVSTNKYTLYSNSECSSEIGIEWRDNPIIHPKYLSPNTILRI
eukprot:GHVR01156605.1.p1 GENE.GHVR01156605.1~~GHVR01156605.1.p1  ORF type:complete len:269 (+),score=33.98 GHVR01156605.1:77-883(+)